MNKKNLWAMLRLVLLAVSVLLSGCMKASSAEAPLTGLEAKYASIIEKDCTFGQGYQCASVDEMTLKMDQKHLVPAPYLLAWPIAYADFLALEDLSLEQKNLKHYQIGFAEDKDHYLIIFNALLLPELDAGGKPQGVSRLSLGVSMRYQVDKQSLEIVSRKRYK